MVTVLTGNRVAQPDGARAAEGELWMPAAECEHLTGRALDRSALPAACFHEDEANVSAIWRRLNRPALSDEAGTVWVLGASARERAAALESLQAPDFTLPDLDGRVHSLSDYRGKKVLLASWASW